MTTPKNPSAQVAGLNSASHAPFLSRVPACDVPAFAGARLSPG